MFYKLIVSIVSIYKSIVSVLGLITNRYPVLSEAKFSANWKHILGLALRQGPFIDVKCIDAFYRGAVPENRQGNFELPFEKSLVCCGSDRL